MDMAQTTLNDEATEQQGPIKKTCCVCIPRRFGIIVLALIKLVQSLWLFVVLLEIIFEYSSFAELLLFYTIIIWIAITLDVVDIVSALVVIISVCVENRRILKTYYLYSFCVFGPITFLCCVIIFIISMNILAILTVLFAFFLVCMMQRYLIHLLKIEVMKLESSEQSGI